MVDNDARRADNRQWDSNSGKIRDGHLKISAGIAPDPLKMKEARGSKGIRIEEIHQLQQEIFEAACLRREKGLAELKKEVEARRLVENIDRSQ
jgi:hypothetical protein